MDRAKRFIDREIKAQRLNKSLINGKNGRARYESVISELKMARDIMRSETPKIGLNRRIRIFDRKLSQVSGKPIIAKYKEIILNYIIISKLI